MNVATDLPDLHSTDLPDLDFGAERRMRVIEPRQAGVRQRLSEFWRSRGLVTFFGKRLLEKTYMRSKLGVLWVPLRPLLNVVTRALVFGGLLRAPSAGAPYFLFFLVGMATWSIFDRSLFWSVRSIELNSALTRKLYFPRLVLPFAAFVPAVIDFLVYVVFIVLTLGYYWIFEGTMYLRIGTGMLEVLAGLVLVSALAGGCALYLSVLGAYTRDVRFSLSYVLGFLFFLTPIIYPLNAVPKPWRSAAEFNPVTAPVEMVRGGLIDAGTLTTLALTSSVVTLVLVCGTGLLFFSRWEAGSVDRL